MQEFYIRHVDGSRVKDEDRKRVIHWLKAAIERRVYEVKQTPKLGFLVSCHLQIFPISCYMFPFVLLFLFLFLMF